MVYIDGAWDLFHIPPIVLCGYLILLDKSDGKLQNWSGTPRWIEAQIKSENYWNGHAEAMRAAREHGDFLSSQV